MTFLQAREYHIHLISYYLFHHTILCGFDLRPAFIKLEMEDKEIHCLKEGGVAADTRESIQRDAATLATAMNTKLDESDPLQTLKRTKMS